ncbi:MAG: response regulator transcription factor [Deltaproteobacteria bacterium]|nr:response regulator transcription factor [Deltaproteobacteria bacterium]
MEKRPKILVTEDEKDLAEPLCRGLIEEGFDTEVAPTGEIAFRRLSSSWDLVILDLALPDIPGESLLAHLRSQRDYPPVLILTARSSVDDKLSLFRQGCDDFLTKPFIFEELVERVRALLRRSVRVKQKVCCFENIVLDPSTYCLSDGNNEFVLTPKEAAILQLLLGSPGRVISRKELLHVVWGLKEEPETNFIAVHLFNLRKKLAQINRDGWLQTVRNSGLTFAKPEG